MIQIPNPKQTTFTYLILIAGTVNASIPNILSQTLDEQTLFTLAQGYLNTYYGYTLMAILIYFLNKRVQKVRVVKQRREAEAIMQMIKQGSYKIDEFKSVCRSMGKSALNKVQFPGHHFALSIAVSFQNMMAVQFLVEEMGVDVNQVQPIDRESPLVRAVYVNSPPIVEYLLKKGADTELRVLNGTTALTNAIIRPNREKIVHLLLSHGA